MKFMKLGSKPDAFQADGKSIRYVSSELATDVIINVGEVKFYLHKFPLLSKSNRLQKLVSKANEENSEEVYMVDFPGGPKSFEICAKFCYGMTVTLNAYNVVAARCAAEYLEMTEDVDRSNLVFKIEVFLNSSIFRSWKDSIIVLQTTKPLLSWAEDLKIVGRCIDSVASKTSVDPANISWSYTYNRKLAETDKIVEEGMNYRVPRDWWVEDICELDIDLYKRVMIAVKSKGRMDGAVIGEALKTYAVRWLPDSVDALVSDEHALRNKSLVETIICLLPSDKGMGCSCSFLLKLLKVSILVGADYSLREDLVKRISLKLHEARIIDLLIPARSPQITIYDVELVQSVVNQFLMHEKCNWNLDVVEKNEKGSGKFILGHGSLLSVGRLIDGYLAEIAHDPNLNLCSFIDLSQSIPESARPIHDGLYKAIDIYLKEHPSLTKAERKRISGLMNVKKLTMEASMDAAQNELLPLRVVVQVLFFEQVRSAAGLRAANNHPSDASLSRTNLDEECDKTALAEEENCKPLGKHMSEIKVTEEFQKNGKLGKKNSKNSRSGVQLLPSRSREKLPTQRQSMLFSATMPTWVKKLARKYLDNPLTIDLVGDQEEKLAEGIKLYALSTTGSSKRTILSDLITVYAKGGKTIVFTQTKRDADEVSMSLTTSIASEALHGDISQHQRERTLNGFRQGKFTVLVATDVASRGLDIPNVDLVIHYELPNDSETFVHRSGRTGRAGKQGTAVLMFTNNQRRTVRTLERDVGCKFEFVSPPTIEEVLESSAQHVVATLSGVHPESVQFFTPTAQKLIDEQGTNALAAALAQLSGFSRPPSSRSLITHEQGWTTLQIIRDPAFARGFLSARSVTGFLSDVYSAAADEVGKIHIIADERVQGAVFDLPEEIAKELLNRQIPPGNTISKITKLPALQDDGPVNDYYGRFSGRDRNSRRGGSRDRQGSSGFRSSRGWGSSDGADDSFRSGGRGGGRGGGRSYGNSNSQSRTSRSIDDDWLIGGRPSSRSSSRDSSRSFGGSCFNCGRSGHRASECPTKQGY